MFRSSKRTCIFFVFHSLIVLGSLIWRPNHFTNQSKHKAVPFLAYLWSVIMPRSEFFLPCLCVTSKQDQDDRSVKPPLSVLDHAQILREVMSVYQSSMLMKTKMKGTQASAKSWTSWLPPLPPCVSPTAPTRRLSDRNGMIKCLFSIAYVTSTVQVPVFFSSPFYSTYI
jgi:hypothetical protein